MKKYLILLLVTLFASPAIAQRTRLRGPRKPNHTYDYNEWQHDYNRRYSNRRNHLHYLPNRTINIVQTTPIYISNNSSKLPVTIKTIHKTILIHSKPNESVPKTITRNQILKESRAKVRYNVYNKNEQKR